MHVGGLALRFIRLGSLALLGCALVLALGVSLAPFVATKWWLVRLLDFPRLQFAIVTLALLLLLPLFARRHPGTVLALALAGLVALGGDVAVLWPYRGLGPEIRTGASCPEDRRLTVMIANVLLTNRQSQTLLDEVRAEKPDVFLAMEVDDWWDRTLEPLAEEMPETAKRITGSYYGIRLFSRLPLVSPEIRFLAGRDTPSVVTGIRLRDGGTFTFLGLHPRPPLPGQSALPRDAELYAAGQLLRERGGPAVLAGDLNATPWEDAVERLRRISGLLDPRRGRGFVHSFDARSWWAKWPLDQVFHGPAFSLLSLARLAPIGSDHDPVLARLCHDPDARPLSAPPESDDDRDRIGEADRAAGPAPAP